ncbi:MAG: hypothetical protein AB4050_11190 [Synechococcus sp.]
MTEDISATAIPVCIYELNVLTEMKSAIDLLQVQQQVARATFPVVFADISLPSRNRADTMGSDRPCHLRSSAVGVST